ncbi:hypothetical protein CsatB_009553 [Cannabis sativa]
MLSVIVSGLVYSLWRLGFSIYIFIANVKRYFLIDFYGDKRSNIKVVCTDYIVLFSHGYSCRIGCNQRFECIFQSTIGGLYEIDEFCSKGYASANLVLIAFLCTAILSVMSSYAIAANTKPSL